MALNWTYEFDEAGGYDCMSGAFLISFNGKNLFDIDLRRFGQKLCDYMDENSPTTITAKQTAEELTKRIVSLLNGNLT